MYGELLLLSILLGMTCEGRTVFNYARTGNHPWDFPKFQYRRLRTLFSDDYHSEEKLQKIPLLPPDKRAPSRNDQRFASYQSSYVKLPLLPFDKRYPPLPDDKEDPGPVDYSRSVVKRAPMLPYDDKSSELHYSRPLPLLPFDKRALSLTPDKRLPLLPPDKKASPVVVDDDVNSVELQDLLTKLDLSGKGMTREEFLNVVHSLLNKDE